MLISSAWRRPTSNPVFVAAADRVGIEPGQPFIGRSVMVSYTGWLIGGLLARTARRSSWAEANVADAQGKCT
jgi:N-carbamoylputrescine amidase